MKAFKAILVLVFVLNIGVAFAEEVASNCGQIDDSVDRSSLEVEGAPSVEAPAAGSSQG